MFALNEKNNYDLAISPLQPPGWALLHLGATPFLHFPLDWAPVPVVAAAPSWMSNS